MWRGRLPHWRADGETYYVTFRHQRDLTEKEREALFQALLAVNARKLSYLMLLVLPKETELIFTVEEDSSGQEYELSDVIEKAKRKAGKRIIKASGERFPPFWHESYDRIIRDEDELAERFDSLLAKPETEGLGDPDSYAWLFIPDQPE